LKLSELILKAQSKKKKKPQVPKVRATPKGDGYHHGDLRSALIDAAIKLLEKGSVSDLSLRELARQAGVSIAAPYRHFKDKRELIAAISQQGFELKFRYMYEGIAKARGNPKEMFFACGTAYFKMACEHPQHFRLMFGGDVCPTDEFPALQMAASKSFLILKRLLIHAQKKKVVGDGDPNHLSINYWSLVHGFTSLFVEGRLGWLGVDGENGEKALKTLISQYLVGADKSLTKSDFGFSPFSTKASNMKKKEMLEQVVPEIESLFY
jgi:AcrR family transcriptional regulator